MAVTLTRALGQSALSVVSIAMVGQWFVRRIDMAMAVYSVVMSVGFMVAFPLVGRARAVARAGASRGLSSASRSRGLVPLAWLLVRRGPEAVGLPPDGSPARVTRPRTWSGTTGPRGLRWSDALRTPAFWVFAIGTALYGLVASGIGLFNESILAERGFGAEVYYQTLVVTAMTALAGNFLGGWLRASGAADRLMAVSLFVLAAGLVALPHVAHAADGDGVGHADGPRRRPRDGAVLQRVAARVRPAPPRPHPGRRAGADRARVGGRARCCSPGASSGPAAMRRCSTCWRLRSDTGSRCDRDAAARIGD